jgi:hypothetical protein
MSSKPTATSALEEQLRQALARHDQGRRPDALDSVDTVFLEAQLDRRRAHHRS